MSLRIAATIATRRLVTKGVATAAASVPAATTPALLRGVSRHPSIANNSTAVVAARFKSSANATAAKKAATGGESASASSAAGASGKAAKAAESTTSEPGVPLGKTILAAATAVATVSAGAALVESQTASSVPTFTPGGERFDQTTFAGRFSKMFLACDPRLTFYSDAEVRRCGAMIEDYESLLESPPDGATVQVMNRTLWEALRIKTAALHPDTGDTIPHPFRMSGYVPFNGPICVAMVASTTTPALLFWSWVNQSQNALVNYFNRNASAEMSNETLVKSYAAAVASALTVAFGLATFIQKRYDPVRAKNLMKFCAFPSAVVASSLNCYIVRSPEIDTGVPLVNDRGEDVLPGETSKEAARRGVNSTTASRAILQAPVYLIPPVLMSTVPPLKNFVAKNPALAVPITTYLLLVVFGFGLPATVAIFPQMSELKLEDAEEKFRKCKDEKTGLPYERLFYNKGL